MNEQQEAQLKEIIELFQAKLQKLYVPELTLGYFAEEGVIKLALDADRQWSAEWKPADDGQLLFIGRALDEVRTKMETSMVLQGLKSVETEPIVTDPTTPDVESPTV